MSTSTIPRQQASVNPLAMAIRSWWFLVWLSLQRQARMRQMLGIALALLAFAAVFVALQTAAGRWDMNSWRYPWRSGITYKEMELLLASQPGSAASQSARFLTAGAIQLALDRSPFRVFTFGVVLSIFLSFLLPIWVLSFATEAIGGERENQSLIWLLSRPLSRPAIYLAKFLALLPWTVGLALGGFGLLCYLAGPPGWLAWKLDWPVMIWTTLAFSALFHLLGVSVRRPAVVAVLYVFFLEILINLMPGYLKRFSISYYARCMIFDVGGPFGVSPENPRIFMPLDATTAWLVLITMTLSFLLIGVLIFSRSQYRDTV